MSYNLKNVEYAEALHVNIRHEYFSIEFVITLEKILLNYMSVTICT